MSTFCQNRVQCFPSVLIGACTFAHWHFLSTENPLSVENSCLEQHERYFHLPGQRLPVPVGFATSTKHGPLNGSCWLPQSGQMSAVGLPWFLIGAPPLFFCVICARYLTSLCLTFFICKMGRPSTSRVVVPLTYSPWLRAWLVRASTRSYYQHYYRYDFASFLFTWNISPSLHLILLATVILAIIPQDASLTWFFSKLAHFATFFSFIFSPPRTSWRLCFLLSAHPFSQQWPSLHGLQMILLCRWLQTPLSVRSVSQCSSWYSPSFFSSTLPFPPVSPLNSRPKPSATWWASPSGLSTAHQSQIWFLLSIKDLLPSKPQPFFC